MLLFFTQLKGVVSPAIVSISAPALWVIIGVIDRKAEFVEDGVKEIPIVEVVEWDATTYWGHQWIGCLWDIDTG